jgi:hypothetical protein
MAASATANCSAPPPRHPAANDAAVGLDGAVGERASNQMPCAGSEIEQKNRCGNAMSLSVKMQIHSQHQVAGGPGFEPGLTESESIPSVD